MEGDYEGRAKEDEREDDEEGDGTAGAFARGMAVMIRARTTRRRRMVEWIVNEWPFSGLCRKGLMRGVAVEMLVSSSSIEGRGSAGTRW